MRDYHLGTTFDVKFTTRRFSTGAPFALASGVISAYPNNSTTQLTAGLTLSADFDGVTGLNNIRVVATSGNGYAAGSNYALVITTGTVDSVSVVGEVVVEFSLEAQSALRPITAGREAAITATGAIGVDWGNVENQSTAVVLAGTSIDMFTATQLADAVLNRDMSAVSDTNARSPLNALRFLRNKWSISGTTLTVTKENDTTTAWTSALTATPAADPITASDPT